MFQDFFLYASDVEMRYAMRLVHLSELVSHAVKMHSLNVPRAKLLGEALVSGCLIASILDDEERVNLRVQCGENYTLATETTLQCETRGYFEAVDNEFTEALDQGLDPVYPLTIRSLRAKDASGKVFEGVTQFLTNSLEDAFNDHIKVSYQTNAKLKIEVWLDENDQWRAYGVIFRELPNLESSVRTELWQHVATLPSFQEMTALSDDPDAIAVQLIPHAVRPIRSLTPSWSCRCSQATVEKMLVTLPIEEVQDMVRGNEVLDIRCHYCSKNYLVSVATQAEILASMAPQNTHILKN